MKLKTTLLILSLGCFLAVPAFAQSRIATVDLRKCFDGFWRTKQADANLKEQAAEMDKEHKGYVDDWNKAKEDYQKLQASAADQAVSADERDKRKQAAEKKLLEVRELEQTIQQFERQARTTLDEKRRRMRDTILKEIRQVITDKSKTLSVSYVIDSAAETVNNTPVLVYSAGDNDLTDAVLLQLNATAPKDFNNKTTETDSKKDDSKKTEEKK